MEFLLTGKPGERHHFVEVLEDFCRRQQVPDKTRQASDLALEEHLTNVLAYGFQKGMRPWVSVRLRVQDNALHVEVTDTGVAYNPLSAAPVDTSVPLEDKPIGGLGVYLMTHFMDELSYRRQDNRNELRMINRSDSEPSVTPLADGGASGKSR